MVAWIGENLGTIIVCALLIGALAAVIVSMIRKKKKGRSGVCDCGHCTSCPMSGSCRKS